MRTKAKRLLYVGFGLPLDALIRGTIVQWACSYRLADGEVGPISRIGACIYEHGACICSCRPTDGELDATHLAHRRMHAYVMHATSSDFAPGTSHL